ncbi:hypothetical protein H7B90_24450 [Cohnella xylanilytica]|uniref:MgsA AAA+ ATPase C-terminal domain-containing protein n=1 Tax=Cohnella xylanilytica TaxID=557555 RepID=A0A841U979_9BACL|nr:hypothetical protein [Cohnella xylanilytica]MBB6694551.1 hypothetical protein [Cohnella xylanilytica]
MSEFLSYDPWSQITTRNGIPGDEIISMLQKSIRRGLEKEALEAAYEMYITSPQFEEKLWRRLQVISVEDIGFGDVQAAMLVNTYNQLRQSFPYGDGDRPLFFVQAIRYLCRCAKERSSDCVKNLLIRDFENGKKPEVPEYALDMHTQRGKAAGKDVVHFLEEASKVSPPVEKDEYGYEEWRKKLLDAERGAGETPARPAAAPFRYNAWQY